MKSPPLSTKTVRTVPLGPVTSLDTQNFTVRSLTPQDDLSAWATWAEDPAIMHPINAVPRKMSSADLQRFVATFDRKTRFIFGIYSRKGRNLVGIYQLKIDALQRTVTFNVLIGDKSYWGKDVVLETRAALLDFVFDKQGVEKAVGLPLVRNFPMIYNYKRQGFKLEGVLKGQVFSLNGGPRLDQYHFGLLREEWRTQKKAPT
jgi:[ribosomal protein S5]-alanine N-acetyltransferase